MLVLPISPRIANRTRSAGPRFRVSRRAHNVRLRYRLDGRRDLDLAIIVICENRSPIKGTISLFIPEINPGVARARIKSRAPSRLPSEISMISRVKLNTFVESIRFIRIARSRRSPSPSPSSFLSSCRTRPRRAKTPPDFISERSRAYCHPRRSLSHSVAASGISSVFFFFPTRRCNDLRLDDRLALPPKGERERSFLPRRAS